jgi:superfamily II DNA/RNA helicase
MFTVEEIRKVMQSQFFLQDISWVRQSLVNERLHQAEIHFADANHRLWHFAEAVLASAPDWSSDDRTVICRTAGEISEALANGSGLPQDYVQNLRLRAALLYELAELPSIAASLVDSEELDPMIYSFFRREGAFRSLATHTEIDESAGAIHPHVTRMADLAVFDDAMQFARAGNNRDAVNPKILLNRTVTVAAQIAKNYAIGRTGTEMAALGSVIENRRNRLTVEVVQPSLVETLRGMSFPLELLPAQVAAVNGGLLDEARKAWGFAAPTGSGKTYLARLAIAELLERSPFARVIYLVPSRALVSEVGNSLSEALSHSGQNVVALSAQLTDLDENEHSAAAEASVIVMTPEKADLILRLGINFMKTVALVIIDEAHHIESGTRGALLELYLWRMKHLLPQQCRYILLSAVAPNIGQIAKWLDPTGSAVSYSARPTRMRVGVYSLSGNGVATKGVIKYSDGTSVQVVASRAERKIRSGIAQLSEFLSAAGPVLVVAKGKKECESIAQAIRERLVTRGHSAPLIDEELASKTFGILDARLEREMYAEVGLRELIRFRIAYHHAGMPPRVRQAVEQAVRDRQIEFVVATTTLAEGVNFPFSSVIVQSLALKEAPEAGKPSRYAPITPRSFWNIAGRAGRPGFDAEGQVILFEPSLGLEQIGGVLDEYLEPDFAALAPVRSALAAAIEEIAVEVGRGSYSVDDLSKIVLPERMSRSARGAVNLLRVGVMHVRATDLGVSPDEIVESSFAMRFLTQDVKGLAARLLDAQAAAVETYRASDDALSLATLAELGLSLETLTSLREYVQGLEDWQLASLDRLFYGGSLNLDQARYIVGPVAKRMAELEGPSLGGFLSDVIVRWLSGVPFTSIMAQTRFSRRLEDLIAVIYSRVQFLLPWGLWATDWLVANECARREIGYDGSVKKMAYLADAGVPSFDALTLFHAELERVDATRLAAAYHRMGGGGTGVDCLGWVLVQSRPVLERILRGVDERRIEYGFFESLEALRNTSRKLH